MKKNVHSACMDGSSAAGSLYGTRQCTNGENTLAAECADGNGYSNWALQKRV